MPVEFLSLGIGLHTPSIAFEQDNAQLGLETLYTAAQPSWEMSWSLAAACTVPRSTNATRCWSWRISITEQYQ